MARRGSKGRDTWPPPEGEFRRELARQGPASLYALIGTESFLAEDLMHAIRQRVLGGDGHDAGFVKFNGPRKKNEASRFDAGLFFDELRSGSLFAVKTGNSFASLADVGTVSIRVVEGEAFILQACGAVTEFVREPAPGPEQPTPSPGVRGFSLQRGS